MPKLDLDAIPQPNDTGYPPPYSDQVAGRWYRRLAPPGGLTTMGASHVVLKPGAWSSQRHWHREEDELLIMLAGEAVLVEDPGSEPGAGSGETVLGPGDICAWPANARNGHHLQNRSSADCTFIAISSGDAERDSGEYPDIDLVFDPEGYARRDGARYHSNRPA